MPTPTQMQERDVMVRWERGRTPCKPQLMRTPSSADQHTVKHCCDIPPARCKVFFIVYFSLTWSLVGYRSKTWLRFSDSQSTFLSNGGWRSPPAHGICSALPHIVIRI